MWGGSTSNSQLNVNSDILTPNIFGDENMEVVMVKKTLLGWPELLPHKSHSSHVVELQLAWLWNLSRLCLEVCGHVGAPLPMLLPGPES